MGRLGSSPVILSDGASVLLEEGAFEIKGPKGSLRRKVPREVSVEKTDDGLVFKKRQDTKAARAMQGTMRAHAKNMVHGVTQGWSKSLEIIGTGYRAEVKGDDLALSAGFSHPVIIKAPEGVGFKVEKSVIVVEGADKELVGQAAADIREVRRPNVYTGSGIKYTGEVIRRKAGKQAAKAEQK